ncbi:DUF1236 domain-containing protein [Rhizobium tubonense]|uniref:DUF1236 domain-containing protein n=1 Tax=Rhizobium tubonense TaxID=484088 RepID=A0A2W4EL45_9HYPH|nr:DUF1236 domain-containing protein [Rhizobium tubonense]PZM11560.1 hypothetical protein CPY51_20245 [Rhizobium tubonense]
MYKALLVSGAMALASLSTNAIAANGAVTGAVGGAATGAIIGGPVGAAVGGVAGAVTGAVLDPPPREVVTYVRQQPAPATTAVIEDPIEVGRPIPGEVEIVPIPDNPHYAYAIVNNQRVIVEPQSHKVIEVIR